MAVAGSFICSITGIDSLGGFHLSLDAILEGLGYAAPPIMALLFILDVSSLLYLYYGTLIKPSIHQHQHDSFAKHKINELVW